jgi:hypothetical protein
MGRAQETLAKWGKNPLPVKNPPVKNLPVKNLPVKNLPVKNLPVKNLPVKNPLRPLKALYKARAKDDNASSHPWCGLFIDL